MSYNRINTHQSSRKTAEANELPGAAQSPLLLDSHKGKLVTGVALLAIGALIAGGLLHYLKINTIAAWSLIGGGSALAVGALIGSLVLFIRHRNASKENVHRAPAQQEWSEGSNESDRQKKSAAYKIVSWNVATFRDYSNLCSIKNGMVQGLQFLEAYQESQKGAAYQATDEESAARTVFFRQAFQQFGNPDIICLQESWEMRQEDIQAILPPGYSFFSYESDAGKECTVVWHSEKFSKIGHTDLVYDPTHIISVNSAPDTIALLKDNANGTTICVCSAHLRGFSLAYGTSEETLKQLELTKAQAGDNQTQVDLKAMDTVQADLYLFAGDFNVTMEHYQQRFDLIARHGYVTDRSDNGPTIYDANLKEEDGITPKPVRLDYIFVKGGKNAHVHIQHIDLPRTELNEYNNRPSDHLPIGAQVQLMISDAS